MKRLIAIAWAAVLIALAVGCKSAPDPQSEAQLIQNDEQQWNQDYIGKDPDKLASYYADDAVLMAPGMSPAVGRDSIRAELKAIVSDPALSLKFRAAKIEVAGSGDLAWTRGAYEMTMTDPQTKKVINDHGSYVATYRKDQNGSWKVVADIATSEVPPGQPATM